MFTSSTAVVGPPLPPELAEPIPGLVTSPDLEAEPLALLALVPALPDPVLPEPPGPVTGCDEAETRGALPRDRGWVAGGRTDCG